MIQKILLVRPRGFCAGVDRAVRTAHACLQKFGPPVYIKHAIVHNETVTRELASLGAVTVERVKDIPDGSVAIFSAHGSPPEQYEEAKRKQLRLIDATCPLVWKVHLEARRYAQSGYTVVYIGHKGHLEGEGVSAEICALGGKVFFVENVGDVAQLPSMTKCAYLTQTTLGMSETKEVIKALVFTFPHIEAPAIRDICYATENRQRAVRALAEKTDIVFVVGSKESSNSNRLAEVARQAGTPSFLVENLDAVRALGEEVMHTAHSVGVTAGASAPEAVVQDIVEYFVKSGAREEEIEVIAESMHFADPIEWQKMNE